MMVSNPTFFSSVVAQVVEQVRIDSMNCRPHRREAPHSGVPPPQFPDCRARGDKSLLPL